MGRPRHRTGRVEPTTKIRSSRVGWRMSEPGRRRRPMQSWPERWRGVSMRPAERSPLGHSFGQTWPYWAERGHVWSSPSRAFLIICRHFAGCAATNALLHTREVAGSNQPRAHPPTVPTPGGTGPLRDRAGPEAPRRKPALADTEALGRGGPEGGRRSSGPDRDDVPAALERTDGPAREQDGPRALRERAGARREGLARGLAVLRAEDGDADRGVGRDAHAQAQAAAGEGGPGRPRDAQAADADRVPGDRAEDAGPGGRVGGGTTAAGDRDRAARIRDEGLRDRLDRAGATRGQAGRGRDRGREAEDDEPAADLVLGLAVLDALGRRRGDLD